MASNSFPPFFKQPIKEYMT